MAPSDKALPIRSSSKAWRWHCHADPLLFITYAAMPAELQQQLATLQLPCHRTGIPRPYCDTCIFATVTED